MDIRTLDTQQPAPDKILARIRKRLEPGVIILLHDRMPGSDQLVKQILDLLKEQGYTVVRPDKTIGIKYKCMRTLLLYLSLFFLSIATVHAQSMKKDGAKDRV